MDHSIGTLPWIFLAAGVVCGAVAVWRLGRGISGEERDLELRRTDLEARHRDLLARLRGETLEELPEDDRRRLELDAAGVLRELEALPPTSRGQRKRTAGEAAGATAGETAAQQPAGRGFWARHPALGGALLGGGIVGLVAVLVVLAVGDAEPRQESAMSGPAPAAGPAAAPAAAPGDSAAAPGAQAQPPLPPFLAQQVEDLRGRLESQPEDAQTRRQLALVLLSGQQFFEAFQEANVLLQSDPADPTALYVSGFVRYVMGQPQEAIELLDRSIANAPNDSQAWLVKGLIQLQLEQRQAAIATWEEGLSAVGGSDPRLEHLLAEARTEKSVEEILASPPPR